jgi:glycosyltransferase involved in cell wall biosynthesis
MKISVAMTTYNGAPYLREQLDSIFEQVRLPDELIIYDDQSTDETPRILQEYAQRSPFPMTIKINERRLGSTKNFEQAIRLCSGDVIALSDQDDIWYPKKLEVIEQRFEEEPGIGLVFSNGDLIDARGERLAGGVWRKFLFSSSLQRMVASGDVHRLVLSMPFITGATMAFRSKFNSFVLPIPDSIATFIHDRWIAVLIAAVARIGMIEEKLIAYRLHPQQQLGVGGFRRYVEPHRCASDQLGLASARERLANNSIGGVKPEFLDALAQLQAHVAARASLSGTLIGRLPTVAREYWSGRYLYYPLGSRRALKDLLVGTK